MTAIVKIDGYPDRLACEVCGCELAAQRPGRPWRTALPHTEYEGGRDYSWKNWTHGLDVDEPPIHLDLEDGCPCHETFLRLLHHAYSPLPPESQKGAK